MPTAHSYKIPVPALLVILAVSLIVAACVVMALNKRFKSSWPW